MNEQKNNINDKWTKLILAVLVVFGISAILLGILRLNNLIYGPLLTDNRASSSNYSQDSDNTQQNQQTNITALMKRDTDGDGLSDYDELYVYHTSIYLKDTDADGYSDKEEVDNGYDPNCPKGQDCRGMSKSNQVDNRQIKKDDKANSDANQLTEQQKQQLMNLNPDQIRRLLLASGKISQAELDKVDDASLKQILKESLDNNQ